MTNATNSGIMKEKNKRLIISLIRKNQISRADIAKITNLTKASVSIIIDDLIKSGIVTESKCLDKGVGRKPINLKINPEFMYAIGINLTRSYIEAGIVDIEGNILLREKLDVYPKNDAIKNLISCVEKLISKSQIPTESIYGIGVTAPGPVDSQNTTILNPVGFEEWHYENIGLRLKNAFNKNIYLENISGGLALCEKYYGVAKDLNDFLLLKISDGIGAGIISGDKLLRNASEFGHTSIDFNGKDCKCGNKGCVERYASIPAILENTNYKNWEQAVEGKDEKLIKKEAEYLSCAIINAVNLFGFESIILGGEINYKPDLITKYIKSNLKKNTISKKIPQIISGSSFSEITSAAITVFDNYFNEF